MRTLVRTWTRQSRAAHSRRVANRAVGALLLAVGLCAVVPGTTRSQTRTDLGGKLGPLRLPGLAETVWGGRFEVPEDRSRTGGRLIALNVVVLPATSDSLARDALAFLAGGGVVPASRYAPFLARAFPELRRHRDILLVDQRGTWNSAPLACGDSLAAAPSPGQQPCDATELKRCLDALSSHADVRRYGTASAMADLDAVRAWLGYEQLDLLGASYGTKAAQVYLRAYPERVRCAVLHGVVPLDRPIELDYARSAQTVFERLVERCAGDPACHAAFPNFAAEFESLLTRPPTPVVDTVAGEVRREMLTDRIVRDLTQEALGSARAMENLPRLVHQSWLGDSRPLLRAWRSDGSPRRAPAPTGVYLTILCGESIARVHPEQVAAATNHTFFGDRSLRSQLCECEQWPRAPLPADFCEPVRSPKPVLVLSGELDPITPPAYGEAVARALGNATHVVLPARSHEDTDPCVGRIIQAFVLNLNVAAADTACLGASHLRFVTAEGADRGER